VEPNGYSYTRYLAAKKTIDDRSLNRGVQDRLRSSLRDIEQEQPIQILEVGAGIGTMITRLIDLELIRSAHYTAIDREPDNFRTAISYLQTWCQEGGWSFHLEGDQTIRLGVDADESLVELQIGDIEEFLDKWDDPYRYDLLIAHAFLDLIDLTTTLPHLLKVIRPGGLFYFTLNFDGITALAPQMDAELDSLIETLYHRTMDERLTRGRPTGGSRTGRQLLSLVLQCGTDILAAGSSDWVVTPLNNAYPADEAYFLHFIVNTIDCALRGHPELDPRDFEAWIHTRHAQIEQGELTYIAHQLDLLGRIPESGLS
jgi:SAM-dependent methyltransferase